MLWLSLYRSQHQDPDHSWTFRNHCIAGQVENADFSDIADFISPTFIDPCFRYSPVVNIENFDLKNLRFSNIRVFNIHLYGEY